MITWICEHGRINFTPQQNGCTCSGDSGNATERQQRIAARIEYLNRIVNWLRLFRVDGESGLGDTYARLLPLSKGRDVESVFAELGARYSCCGKEVVQNLNERWPY